MTRPWAGSCRAGPTAEAQRLAAALYFFWYTRGWFVTGLRWLHAALAAEAPVEPLVRLRAEVGLAQLAFIAGDYLASFAAIESALPAARLLGDDVVLARCLATAGYVWWFLDPERSAALFEEGLEAADRGGDDWTRSTGLAGLGWARYFAGRFDAATGPLREAIELTARSGRRQQFAMAVLGRAAVEPWLGRLGGGGGIRTAGAGRDAGDRRCLLDQCGTGDPGRDRTHPRPAGYGRAARSRGHRDRRAGQVGHQRDDRHRAPGPHPAGPRRTGCRPAISSRPCNWPAPSAVRPLLAWWLDSLGELAELEGRYGDARSWYEQAAGHAAECGLAADAARARHHLGRLAWLRGDRASAVNSCHEALAGQLEAGDRLGLVETLETLGGLLIDEGSARRGLPLLAAAAAAREGWVFPSGRWRPAGSRAG